MIELEHVLCILIQMTSSSKSSSLEKYYLPLKEGEEAHWEVCVCGCVWVWVWVWVWVCGCGCGYMQYLMVLVKCTPLLVQVVERILFVHAKCNKGIGYVQVLYSYPHVWYRAIYYMSFNTLHKILTPNSRISSSLA